MANIGFSRYVGLKSLGVERYIGLDQEGGEPKPQPGVIRNRSQGQGFSFLEKFLLSQGSEAASTNPFLAKGGRGPLRA